MTAEGQTERDGNGQSLLWFFLRFIAASLALFVLHMKAGFIYMRLLAWGARPLLAIFGQEIIMERAESIAAEVSLNPAVFLSLVIALSGVAARKKITAAIVGTAILTAANILTVFLVFMSYYMNNEKLWTGTEFLNLTINFFLPLLLFIILMPIKRLFFTDPSSL
ncbi:MAG: hypothetical protein JW814_04465 [Candidatus Krumholzibacteriota bacterium]|nr:hypothetical protein [Candidatus Krumholzibacteriota bacterium]